MKLNDFDKNMAAATFAEANDHETAAAMAPKDGNKNKPLAARNKKPYGKMIIFGVMSACLYFALLTNEEWVTNTFTKGHWYTVWPIGTAFLFSFIHGAFASNFISVLGLEAKK